MPAKTSTAGAKPTGRLNPTITVAFKNDKFGYGSIKSKAIDQEGFEQIQRHLQVGSSLLIKKSKTVSQYGNDQYFIEILPPYEGKAAQPTKTESSEI